MICANLSYFFFPEALHRQSRHWLESKYFTQWMLNILLKPAKGILKENRWHCKTNSSELLVGKKKREDHCSLHNGLFGDRKGQNVDWGCEILYKEKEILLLINFLQKANFDMRWSYTQHLSKFCLSHKDLLLKPSKVRSYWKKMSYTSRKCNFLLKTCYDIRQFCLDYILQYLLNVILAFRSVPL